MLCSSAAVFSSLSLSLSVINFISSHSCSVTLKTSLNAGFMKYVHFSRIRLFNYAFISVKLRCIQHRRLTSTPALYGSNYSLTLGHGETYRLSLLIFGICELRPCDILTLASRSQLQLGFVEWSAHNSESLVT